MIVVGSLLKTRDQLRVVVARPTRMIPCLSLRNSQVLLVKIKVHHDTLVYHET